MAGTGSRPFSLERWVARQWRRLGLFARLLWPLSIVFGTLSAARRFAYRAGLLASHRLAVPVIVVGNITVGGAGKTPLVLLLCEALRAAGARPGVVSRGYGGRLEGITPVVAGSAAQEVGDEPVLMASRAQVPVWVGRDRVLAARALLAAHPEVDVLVADDGLQHYALQRDLEVVVMDERGAGNGCLLPAGPLREPLSRLRGVDALVMHGALPEPFRARLPARRQFSMRLEGAVFHSLANPAVTCPACDFVGATVHAIAGIGHPPRFFAHLRALGLFPLEHPFPDHHSFRAEDLVFSDAHPVVMTEKDAVKCAAFARDDVWVLRVDAVIEPNLMPLVREVLNGRKSA